MKQTEKIMTLAQLGALLNSQAYDGDIITYRYRLNRATPTQFPLRIDALIVCLCKRGKGRLGIDLREFEVKENTLMVIQPQNYLHLAQIEEDVECDVVACSHNIVSHILPKFSTLLPLIINHRTNPVMHLTMEEAREIEKSFTLIKEVLEKPASLYKREKLICLMQSCLYGMMEVESKYLEHQTKTRTRKDEIIAKFIMAVTENFRDHRNVKFYANLQSISAKHLSSVVKDISRRTAGEWIEQYVTMEAKMLLRTTSLSIKEIAAELNFKNQSFFGKYFKYRTGLSPMEYRKNGDSL